jgi:predicted metal-dependent phosphoesterase TrpH
MTARIDLHTHSTASDGAFSPSEVVRLALVHRLDVLALTDHDSTNGIAEAQAAARGTPLSVLPGIELATTPPDGNTMDVLGYLYDPDDAALQARLDALRANRLDRAALMVERLAGLGVPVSYERVLEIAGEGAVTRPHVAQALLEAGQVATFQEAFDRFLGDGRPANVPHAKLTPQEAIALLHAAGGVAVLAHPIRLVEMGLNPEAVVADLTPHGLDGLEVYYPDHTPDFTLRMRVLARRFELVMTGGSDFHRREGDTIRLGSQPVPAESVDHLRQRAARYARR